MWQPPPPPLIPTLTRQRGCDDAPWPPGHPLIHLAGWQGQVCLDERLGILLPGVGGCYDGGSLVG